MAENNNDIKKNNKSPALAAFLSIFPGMGTIYAGNVAKGIAYLLIFVSLIILQIKSYGSENVVFALLISFFYIFQIFDASNEAKKSSTLAQKSEPVSDAISFSTSIFILIIGVMFQLATLGIFPWRKITKLWPAILIAIGIKVIIDTLSKKEEKNEQ